MDIFIGLTDVLHFHFFPMKLKGDQATWDQPIKVSDMFLVLSHAFCFIVVVCSPSSWAR